MARQGKIARLPHALREQVNVRLLNGEPATEQNLSNWRQAGYAEWLARREKTDSLKTLSAFALDLSIRASSQGGKAVDQLFQIHPTEDPVSKYTLPIPVGDGQWLIARMDGEEKVREQTFAEARAEARAKLIEEKATAAMKTAAEDADGGRSCDRRTGFPGATEWQQPIASSYIYNSVELGLSVFASPEFLEFNP